MKNQKDFKLNRKRYYANTNMIEMLGLSDKLLKQLP